MTMCDKPTEFTSSVREDWELWQNPDDRMEWLAKTLSISLDKIDSLYGSLISRWIKVQDKLPEGFWSKNHQHLSEEVLVANSAGIDIAHYNRDDGCWYVGQPVDKVWIDKITHWMPLPPNPHFTKKLTSVDYKKIAIADVIRHCRLGLVSHQPDDSPISSRLRVSDVQGKLHYVEASECTLSKIFETEEYWRALKNNRQ